MVKLPPLFHGSSNSQPAPAVRYVYPSITGKGYEASLILRAAGFTNVKVLDGGIAMWPYETEMP
jgi:rhodanese-related sulfurtransferase